MPVNARWRTVASWLAACAMLLSALAPTLAHAFRGEAPPSWAQICSATGASARNAGLQGPIEPLDGTSMQGMKHCLGCLTAEAVGLPPPVALPWSLPVLAGEVPRLFLVAPQPLFAWASVQPRGPPATA